MPAPQTRNGKVAELELAAAKRAMEKHMPPPPPAESEQPDDPTEEPGETPEAEVHFTPEEQSMADSAKADRYMTPEARAIVMEALQGTRPTWLADLAELKLEGKMGKPGAP